MKETYAKKFRGGADIVCSICGGYPKKMRRMSRPLPLTEKNINRIPPEAHGVYIICDKDGAALYVGRA